MAASAPVAFRRLFINMGQVLVEVGPGEVYWLPGRYDARVMFKRIKAAGVVDLSRWRRLEESKL